MADKGSSSRWTVVTLRRRRPSVPDEVSTPSPPACFAPHAGVYFQPDGIVRPCCTTANRWGRIGGPDRATLGSILGGERAAGHRAALDGGDFSLGCWECEIPARQGRREASLAVHFDRFIEATPLPHPKLMDFALSNHCNLQCVMCNGELSSAIRSRRDHLPPLPTVYDDAFFAELREYLPHLERAQFKGGEPFLSRETQRVWDLLLELGVDCEVSVTTNGTIWNDRVERYLRDLRMHAIVSVDGMTPATFEAIRVGARFDQVWENVDRIEAVTSDTGEGMTLSFCLMPQNHHELGAFLLETQRRDCNPNVILVNQPEEHDLTRLPLDELQAIVDDLEREGRDLEPSLDGPHRNEWRQALDRLRGHLRHPIPLWGPHRVPGDPIPHHGGSPGDRPPVDETAVRAELEAWAGCPPLGITIVDTTVTSVDVPRWAEWLEPQQWIGVHPDAIQERMAARLGGEPTIEMTERADGLVDLNAHFGSSTDGPGPEFRILVVRRGRSDGATETLTFVAPARNGGPSSP